MDGGESAGLSLLLASLGVAGAILVGRAFARSLRNARDRTAEAPVEPKGHPRDAPPEAADPLSAFPCHLGDVVLAHQGEEAWLAGALVFFERLPMAILFIAPDAGGGRAIYAHPAPELSLAWLVPLPADSFAIGPEPPSSLEHDRERFERTRRLPYRVERMGTGAPDVGEKVIVAEYRGKTGDQLLIVAGGGNARAWLGRRLEPGMYDVLPSGKSTLNEI
jgi:hypothetical protein